MRMAGASSASARVPSGLDGPGPMLAGIPRAQAEPGLYQTGSTTFSTTFQCPVGVSYPDAPVATGHDFTITPFSYRYSLFSPVRTRIAWRTTPVDAGGTSWVTSRATGSPRSTASCT